MLSRLARERTLGPLEIRLLRALWRRGDATVRELISGEELEAAYTTVMTTLDRLYKKGVLDRARESVGRAFRYRPRLSQKEFFRTTLGADLTGLLESAHPAAPVSFLVDTITEHDAALLDALQRAIQQKKRELRKAGRS